MARRSRIVAFLRILLPLTALAILSTLFLFSERKEPGRNLPYSEVTAENIDQRPAVSQPTYAGVATDGTEIEMTANSATPGGSSGHSSVDQVNVTLRNPEGGTAHLVAGSGEMEGEVIRLGDGAKMTTSTGWQLTSKEFVAHTEAGSVVSKDPVEAIAPFGTLNAAEMELRTLQYGSKQHVLDLKGGVRMLYQP